MIKPLNNHILIDPIKQDGFISTVAGTYEEAGIVLDVPDVSFSEGYKIHAGDTVFFDSWLAAKYPIPGETDKFYWLVPYASIRAKKDAVPE